MKLKKILKPASPIFALLVFIQFSYAQHFYEQSGEYLGAFGKNYNATKLAAQSESFNAKNSFSIGLTYQLSSTETYSVSAGFGIYFGYRYSFSAANNTAFAGGRLLFSFENFEGKTSRSSLLITPFGELGYHSVFAKHFAASGSAGYGYTIRFSKDYNSLNEDIGGRIMPSAIIGYRF